MNAWFVLNGDSHDWDRLTADGFRLVSYGTREHTLLMLNCRHLISSQVDHYVVRPLDTHAIRRPEVAVHVSSAWRHQGRSIAVAEWKANQSVRYGDPC